MDRNWMCASRLSREYAVGVDDFLEFASKHAVDRSRVCCPCVRCGNLEKLSAADIKDHLIVNGIDQHYTRWIWHDEDTMPTYTQSFGAQDEYECDGLEDMIHATAGNVHDRPEVYDQLLRDAEEPLYEGCSKFTRLSAVLKLYNLKAAHGWTDKSFTCLLQLLSEMLPQDHCLPNKTYDAKKILCSMGLNYEKIHACPNDCILYRGDYASLDTCPNPTCGASRYKRSKVPAKVLWYFPIIPRFRRLFGHKEDAKHMTWHADERLTDGMLRHPADSPQWKFIDSTFPEFGIEPRNPRVALCTDGMNPFGSLSSSYSTWPVLLTVYNFPHWLCMKCKYMMLSLLISGPRQPGNDIDVFFSPLIDDLKLLWDEGVDVFYAHRDDSFRMRALLFCTINDFPAYGNLSGYSVKGHYACPICEEDTSFCQLKHSKKTVYLDHRRFLPLDHPYRKQKKAFNGQTETRRAPRVLNGEELHQKLKDIHVTHGKKNRKELPTTGWKRRSVFYELSYWKSLFVRHCLDVMHIEKNVCDSLIGTLLNVPGKSKDGVKARDDLVEMGIRTELAAFKEGNRTYLPAASHTLSRKEKMTFCEFLHGVKVPEGHCSSIRSLVSLNDLKLVGLKSHDCHVMMHQLLPIAIRGILPKRVRNSITRLCFFFNAICSKVIDPESLSSLQKEIVIVLCQLEMYFPPSFFDIMVHLTVHLVNEVKLCGPVYLRWMYPFERYMKVLKGYVKNTFRLEGCMAERYIAEEAAEFCSTYLSGVDVIGVPKFKHMEMGDGVGISGRKVITISREMRDQAHLYVLHNESVVDPYAEKHKEDLRRGNPGKSERWIMLEHNRTFIPWLSQHIGGHLCSMSESVPDRLRWLSYGPSMEVVSYSGYRVNGYTFYTKDHDDKSVVQNSGVALLADALHVASAKDKNPIFARMQYYGVIRNIWVLDYDKFVVPIFGCDWIDNNNGVQDDSGFTLVDLKKLGHKEDPFILATQAKQVFYVCDPSHRRWSVVLPGKSRVTDGVDEASDIIHESPFLMAPSLIESELEGVYVREDHDEGIWIEKTKKRRRNHKRSNQDTCLLFSH